MRSVRRGRRVFRVVLVLCGGWLSGVAVPLLGTCGPFTDVVADSFCPLVLEVFYMGITTGTTPTTYDPAGTVNRLQMAAFLSRGVDGLVKRASRRTALDQSWTPKSPTAIRRFQMGLGPYGCRSDGTDVWVAGSGSAVIFRNRASDGYGFQGWTGATNAQHVVIARGLIYAIGDTDPGRLYEIEPANPPGSVTTVASNLGSFPFGGAFDGERLWAACNGAVCIATPQDPPPFSVMTATTGFSRPFGMLYDGANIWVTDRSAGSLLKLDGNGAILQTVTVGSQPGEPAFDGTNLWVPVGADSAVAVVRASTGVLLRTLTGNGLNDPFAAAFDGQRVLVTNIVNPSVSLWEAAGLSVLGNVSLGNLSSPRGACSDGTRFWIALIGSNQLGMF